MEELPGAGSDGEKSAKKLVGNIAASKTRGLARLLNALSIRHVGNRVAAVLAEHFGSMDELLAAADRRTGGGGRSRRSDCPERV